MKYYLIPALAFSAIAFSCNNGTPDNVKAADTANFRRSDSLQNAQSVTDSTSVTSMKDADFMVKALSGGMLEVELGKLAQANAASPRVKAFGQMMIEDHGQGDQRIRSLSLAKRIVLPDSISNAQKKERDDLQKKTGHDFDRAYVKLMIQDHKEDIDEFKKEVLHANDADIKVFAGNTIPMLEKHLDSAENIRKSSHNS